MSAPTADESAPLPARWRPDEQLIASIKAGSGRKMSELSEEDQSWVVAGLWVDGWKAEAIKDRLKCCVRTVRAIRARPMTRVCEALHTEIAAFENSLRMAQLELHDVRAELTSAHQQLNKSRIALSRLVDTKAGRAPEFFSCGHKADKYNSYFHQPSGRVFCRQCRRDAQATYRDKLKARAHQVGGVELSDPIDIIDDELSRMDSTGTTGTTPTSPLHRHTAESGDQTVAVDAGVKCGGSASCTYPAARRQLTHQNLPSPVKSHVVRSWSHPEHQ